eukprot:1953059-Amphidinium_carterae.1
MANSFLRQSNTLVLTLIAGGRLEPEALLHFRFPLPAHPVGWALGPLLFCVDVLRMVICVCYMPSHTWDNRYAVHVTYRQKTTHLSDMTKLVTEYLANQLTLASS